jgi:hypothetical protein
MSITINIPSITINIGTTNMATLQEVLDTVSAIANSVTAVRGDIQMLKDQLAAGSPVTQQQLDDLLVSLQSVASDVTELDSETP